MGDLYCVVRVSDGVIVGASASNYFTALSDAAIERGDDDLTSVLAPLLRIGFDEIKGGEEANGYRLERREIGITDQQCRDIITELETRGANFSHLSVQQEFEGIREGYETTNPPRS